jgi:hypothetical protein
MKTKMKRSRLALLLTLLLCLAPLFANPKDKKKEHAKEPYALIYGTVYGPDDHVVQGVRVLIRKSDAKKPKYELVSDSRGEFAQRVPVGPANYVISADPKSFPKKTEMKPGKEVTLHINADERQDTSLHLEKK